MTAFRRLDEGRPHRPRSNRSTSRSTASAMRICRRHAGLGAARRQCHDWSARSFKYHRPRGIVSRRRRGTERSFHAWRRRRDRAQYSGNHGRPRRRPRGAERRMPGPRPTSISWRSIRWPQPFFQSGFYYKTFMGPTKRCLDVLRALHPPRRRPGGGDLRAAIPTATRRAHEFCDVLVVGSGPAGLAAALTAGRSGARVVLVEQDSEFGGSFSSERTRPIRSLAESATSLNLSIACAM